jgi:hypothetical protein
MDSEFIQTTTEPAPQVNEFHFDRHPSAGGIPDCGMIMSPINRRQGARRQE